MNRHQTEFKHPRIKCEICGIEISQKHLGRHKMRRHSSNPSNSEMPKMDHTRPTQTNQPMTLKTPTAGNQMQQAIEDQSKKKFSDDVRFVKVRISEPELIKLMNRGRIYYAVGKFFMYDS